MPASTNGWRDAVLGRRDQAGPVVAKIVQIGARGDRPFGHVRDAIVEIGLAEIAAIDRVRAVVGIGEFTRVHLREPPAEPGRMVPHAGSRLCRHGRRQRMHDQQAG